MKRFILLTAALLLAAAWHPAAAEEPQPVIMISEVMTSNDSVKTYPEAGYTDWVELFNSGEAAFLIDGSWKVGYFTAIAADLNDFAIAFVPGKGERAVLRAPEYVGSLIRVDTNDGKRIGI